VWSLHWQSLSQVPSLTSASSFPTSTCPKVRSSHLLKHSVEMLRPHHWSLQRYCPTLPLHIPFSGKSPRHIYLLKSPGNKGPSFLTTGSAGILHTILTNSISHDTSPSASFCRLCNPPKPGYLSRIIILRLSKEFLRCLQIHKSKHPNEWLLIHTPPISIPARDDAPLAFQRVLAEGDPCTFPHLLLGAWGDVGV